MPLSRTARAGRSRHLCFRPTRPRIMTFVSDEDAETILRRAIRSTLQIAAPRLQLKCETPELGECELRLIRFGDSALVGIAWCSLTDSCCATLCLRGESSLEDEMAISAFHDMLEQSVGTTNAASEAEEILTSFREFGRPAVLHFQMSPTTEHSPIPRQIAEWIASEFERISS